MIHYLVISDPTIGQGEIDTLEGMFNHIKSYYNNYVPTRCLCKYLILQSGCGYLYRYTSTQQSSSTCRRNHHDVF